MSKKPGTNADAVVSLRMPQKLRDALWAYARHESRTASAQAIRAIEIYLQDPEACEAIRKSVEPKGGAVR